jgi:two-component sensor histidine kinase
LSLNTCSFVSNDKTMKQKKILIVAIVLLLPLLGAAQNPFLKLKPDGWFKVQVNTDGTNFKDIGAISNPIDLMTNGCKNQYDIRYLLTKQLPDGHELYNASVERIKVERNYNDIRYGPIMGYDSYYPPYLQSNNDTTARFTFSVEIDSQGNVVKVDDHNQNYPTVTLSEIVPKKQVFMFTISDKKFFNRESLASITNLITRAVKRGDIRALNGTPIPGLKDIKSAVSILTVAASFQVPKNVVITGKILNAFKTNNKPEIYTDQGTIKLAKDGSFKTEMLLTGARPVLFIYGQNSHMGAIKPFIAPGDTLTITANGQEPEDMETVKRHDRDPLYGGSFSETVKYGGRGAADAAICEVFVKLAIAQGDGYPEMEKAAKGSTESFTRFQQAGKRAFNAEMEKFKGKASKTALDYYRTEWMYLQAEAKLSFLQKRNYLYSPQSTEAFEGFPKGYFADIENLPVLLNDYPSSDFYKSCIVWLNAYRGSRLAMINGGQNGFLAGYITSLASFKGYALYLSISSVLIGELHRSDWENTAKLKPYYQDFINNCGDTVLTQPVKRQWEQLQQLAPGKPNPIVATLSNGRKLDFEKFKGKPLCLIINYTDKDNLQQYEAFIRKQDPAKVQFVIIQLVASFAPATIDSAFLKLPNVTYAEVTRSVTGTDMYGGESRVFFFDQWQRVVEDNLIFSGDFNPHSPNSANNTENLMRLDDALKKATASARYSPGQKAKFYTILGWGASSILFAVLGGFFIYRGRLEKAKRAIMVKQRIAELEIKAIRSQMNPHFIFNALNSIQSLINTRQYKEANIYLEKFSVMMRKVLNNSEKSMVALSEELEAVTLYCQLEQLRFDFGFALTVAADVNSQLIEIPGMIIQPIVENAIIHGLATKGSDGTLGIKIYTEADCLKVAVTDNGPGFKNDIFNLESFGLKLVTERLNILKADAREANMTINNHIDKAGVTVTLTFPIN